MSSIKYLKNHLDTLVATVPKFTKKSKFGQSQLKIDDKPLSVKLSGILFMPPTKQDGPFGTKYSMGVEFADDDMVVFETALEKMSKMVDDDYVVKHCHNNGSMFLNLTTDKTGDFNASFNVTICPSQLEHSKIEKQGMVSVEMLVNGWYMNDSEKKFGLTFAIKKIFFGNEKVVPKRRKKMDEEEVSE